jgi:branched-chain amino acid transport system permease protein
MKKVAIILIVIALCALPFVVNSYIIRLATIMMMYSVLALSWNFIGGMAGYPSFATAAFFGIGSYVGAIIQSTGVFFGVAWLAAGIVALIFAAILGRAILHLKGHYFAIASLVMVEVLREIVNTNDQITGGGMGMNLPILKLSIEASDYLFYYSMFAVALMTLGVTVWVYYGKLGFGLRCIQQNEAAADMLGVNSSKYKIFAFSLSAIFTGVVGAIYASWINYIEPPDVFDIFLSVKPIVMVLMGGMGTIFGPIIGAVAFLALEEIVWRNFLTVHSAALGLMIVLLVLFLPQGAIFINYQKYFKRWMK